MNNYRILVVDDDTSVTTSLALLLKQRGLSSTVAHHPAEALKLIEESPFDLVIQDMNFSRQTTGEEGMQLLSNIKTLAPQLPVLLMTAWGSIALAVEGIRRGARDFITKPWDNERLIQTIETSLSLTHADDESTMTRAELDEQYDFSAIIGEHPALLKVLTTVARVSKTDASVMILGESGTGKELIADALHINSHRCDGPLVKVNLGGLSTSLFESEMFGHVKGAFTDAKQDRTGRFALADGGSIFLDELGELDKSAQVKLLRVLQDQTFQPVGSSHSQRTNVRVISATNCNLEEMTEKNEFREDLLYRLNLITLKLPPLRERRSDIPLLIHAHLEQVQKMYGLSPIQIDTDAIHWLTHQSWPGNIRQLKQTIERTVLMSGSTHLSLSDFVETESTDESKTASDEALPGALSELTLDEMEKLMIEKAIVTHEGNISRIAEALGLSRAALYRRLDKYEIRV